MILFRDKKDCCACGACEQACPKSAIYFYEDEYGFRFPKIDDSKCINCGLCQRVCAFQNIDESNEPHEVYAATSLNDTQKAKSASGGIFAALASHVISHGGAVCGAVMERISGKFVVHHKIVEYEDDLAMLQGSKYVQSEIGDSYNKIKTLLLSGKLVLFSGTPCQCAGLKGFLRKDYDNLWIVDIICHGVPNQSFFNAYIDYTFKKYSNISSFTFRDKTKGWELAGKMIYGGNKHIVVYPALSSYYTLFLKAQTYRENCYCCKYACKHRPGDITLGDYWGIQKEHPELLKNGLLTIKSGVSCIIVNTSRGKSILDFVSSYIKKFPSTYEKASQQNGQLTHPSLRGGCRDAIFNGYRDYGYAAVDELYKRKYRKQRAIHSVFCRLPYWFKSIIRKYK